MKRNGTDPDRLTPPRPGRLALALLTGVALLSIGCVAPATRSPLSPREAARVEKEVADSVKNDPFPTASELGL